RRLEPRGRVEGIGELEELGRLEPTTPRRTLDRRSDVTGGADPDPGPLREQGPGLVGLVEAAGDHDRVAGWQQGVREASRRRERGLIGQAVADLRELEERDTS